MSKMDPNKISYVKQDKLLEEFCEVIHKLKTKEAIFDFLKDLLNRQERLMLVRRVLVAKMLVENKTYVEIQDKLKASPVTISRIDRALNFGRGGYRKALKQK